VKERPLPNNSFYTIVNQLSDGGQKISRNMGSVLIRLKYILKIVLFGTYN